MSYYVFNASKLSQCLRGNYFISLFLNIDFRVSFECSIITMKIPYLKAVKRKNKLQVPSLSITQIRQSHLTWSDTKYMVNSDEISQPWKVELPGLHVWQEVISAFLLNRLFPQITIWVLETLNSNMHSCSLAYLIRVYTNSEVLQS